MSLIPLILRELNFKSTEAAIKYFLAQTIASIILISTACFETLFEFNFYLTNFRIIIFISLAIKAGLAPFHLWFPQVVKSVSWFKRAIILTWQKIAPFVLIASFSNKIILYALIIIATLIGALGGLNQIDNKLLLTYSSIAHSAWLLTINYMSVIFWAVYFFLYVFIVIPIITSFFKLNLTKITEINKAKISFLRKNTLIFIILSLGGLPPLLGFTAKLYTITLRIKFFPLIILIIIISSSLISLFYYIKLFYTLSIGNLNSVKIKLTGRTSTSNTIIIISFMGNLVISLIVLLI